MNLKSDDLEIDFIFKMKEGEQYRFLVTGKRDKKNFQKVKKFERSVTFRKGDEWIPTEKTAEEIIGLSYENFRRAVIIPQGQFEEFLRLGKTERTRMMKDIFVLGKYDLSGRVKSLETANKEKTDILTGNLAQFSEVTKEGLQTAKAELKIKEKEVKETTSQVKTLQKAVQKAEALKEVFAQVALAKTVFEKVEIQEKTFADLELKIKQTEDCLIRFKPLLDKRNELESKSKGMTDDILMNENQATKITTDLAQKQKDFIVVKEQFAQRETELAKVKDLHNLSEIKSLSATVAGFEKRIVDGQIHLDKVIKDLKVKKLESEENKTAIKSAEQNRPDSKELTDLQLWFSRRKNLAQTLVETQNELTIAEEKFAASSTEFRGVLETSGCSITAKNMSGALKELEVTLDSKEQEIQTVEKEREHWQLKSKLEEYAADLEEGAACPICGATEHPDVIDSAEAKAEIAKIEQKIIALKSASKNLSNCIGNARVVIAKAEERNRTIIAKKAELKEKTARQKEYDASFSSKNYGINDEEKVMAALKELELAEANLQKLRAQTEKLYQEEEALEKTEKQYTVALTKIKNDLAAAMGKKEGLVSQLSVLEAADFADKTADDLRAQAEAIQKNITLTEQQFNSLNTEIETLNQQKNSLAGQLSELKKQEKTLVGEKAKMEEEIKQRITASDYLNEEEILQILLQPLDLTKAKSDLETYKVEFQKAKLSYENLQAQTKGQSFDNQIFVQQKEQFSQVETRLKEQSESLGKQMQITADLEKKLAEKKLLEKDLSALKKRGENIAILKSLFRQEGFVSYISSVYLQNLCEAANYRFYQLTKQQLRLELAEDNSFDVRDFLNDGKLRNVKTLSGGQTFQASLSLALALAESVQKQNETDQNFFFLDEGFGTQDKQSLQAVFEALKSLRKENRIVGVISHVEELQQEIDVSLLIEKDEERGSFVRASWE